VATNWSAVGLISLTAGAILVASVTLTAHSRALAGSRVVQRDFYPADLYRPLDRSDWDVYYWGHKRYWSDVCEAVRSIVDGVPVELSRKAGLEECQAIVARETSRRGIAPWEFWRTMPREALFPLEGKIAPWDPKEDRGRSFLLSLGFHLFGGVAPLLLLWMATLAFLPVLCWIAFELVRSGHALAGGIFLGLVAFSPFVVDCLLFPHSGIGFYIGGLGVLVALACGLLLGPPPSRRGLLLRALCAGLALGLCAVCRNNVILLAPGFLLALLLGVRRTGGLLCGGTAFVLLLLPLLPSRSLGGHDVWLSFWEGLGDFDRTKGHVWSDEGAVDALKAAGVDPRPSSDSGFINERATDILKQWSLRDIREDPSWYATILGKRTAATLLETKLWPYRQRYGTTYAKRTSRNEGSMDGYYRWVRTVDQVGFGPRNWEVPVFVIVVPTVVWIALALLWGKHETLLVLACVALGAIASPVLITVGSAYEPQAFALVYFLGAGLLVEGLALRVWASRLRSRRGGTLRQNGGSA
jgi:hypothetical protein